MKQASRAGGVLGLLFLLCCDLAHAYDSLGEIALRDLPPEAQRTVTLIHQGGPFPFRKDGVAFGNRERRLPRVEYGYYREYTVPTPGSPDRGARRIVAGGNGELYYSDDHYRSFRRILE